MLVFSRSGIIIIGGGLVVGGCQLIAGVDKRAELEGQGGAGAQGAVSSSNAQSGTGGTGTVGGTGGAGGVAGSGGCAAPTDCPDPMGECVTATCTSGMCGTENVAADTAITTQTPGDCKISVCDGMGGVISVNNDADSEDGTSCTNDTCNAGMAVHTPVMAGMMCTDNGGTVCSSMGTCVECNVGLDCAGGICTNNQCVQINGCDATNTVVMTGMPSVTVAFGGMMPGMAYDPPCLRVSMGTQVTFSGPFATHPLQGGEVVNMVPTPATTGPFATETNTGMNQNFTMSSTGTFPYYCTAHFMMGMMGTIFVQ